MGCFPTPGRALSADFDHGRLLRDRMSSEETLTRDVASCRRVALPPMGVKPGISLQNGSTFKSPFSAVGFEPRSPNEPVHIC